MADKKKNLLLMVPMLHQGGFERVCIKTARLMQEFYNVHILIFSSKDINFDVTGLDVIDIDIPAKKGMFNKIINVFKRVIRTRSIKKELHADISYSFGSSANYVNVLSRGKERVLTGLRCQTDMESKRQVKLFCKGSTQVLSCSKEIVRQLQKDFNYGRSTYIYNPLDIADVEKKAGETITDYPFNGNGLVTFSCMARNDYIKGIWHLVKAFYLAQKESPNIRLIIMGAGNWDRYKKMAKSLGISDKVAFMGLKKNPFPYVASSDIYVCSSNHEGFPNAVLEAMALKKPVISADCKTGPREILLSESEYEDLIERIPDGASTTETIRGEYGILVPDMDEREDYDPGHNTDGERMLSREMVRLAADKAERDKYSGKAFERALFYTPEKYKKSIHEIFKRYE
ncbi:MAG: glycosyltransferase [Butyrivibrio sp.]|nr:glycosyltransferase [Butyrivibrio sp.]